MLTEHQNLLAASLAEKLCFRVHAFVEWIDSQKISAEQLVTLHRTIHEQGVNSDFSTAILVAFVNNEPYKKIRDYFYTMNPS